MVLIAQKKYEVKVDFHTSEIVWIKAFNEDEAREKVQHMFGSGVSFPGVYSGQRWEIESVKVTNE